MAVLWTANCGKVKMLKIPGAPSTISGVDVSGISFDTRKSIITSVAISESCNVQFLHTLGDQIYVYTFGDRMGQISIGGMSFAANCQDTAGAEHGLLRIRDFFHENKVSKKKTPLKINIGASGEPIQAFLLGWTGRVVQSDNRVYEWGMQLAAIPQED